VAACRSNTCKTDEHDLPVHEARYVARTVLIRANTQAEPRIRPTANTVYLHARVGSIVHFVLPHQVSITFSLQTCTESVSAMSSPTRRIVLCVDDEDSQLALRKMVLEDAGFEFLGVRSGTEALELFRNREIAVVVLDYWMSGMKGTEIAEKMRRLRPTIPLIIVSGFGLLPGEASLVNAWFQKGRLQPEDLVREVKRLVDRPIPSEQAATS
jgi:CheY-like chemotaxis protein